MQPSIERLRSLLSLSCIHLLHYCRKTFLAYARKHALKLIPSLFLCNKIEEKAIQNFIQITLFQFSTLETVTSMLLSHAKRFNPMAVSVWELFKIAIRFIFYKYNTSVHSRKTISSRRSLKATNKALVVMESILVK